MIRQQIVNEQDEMIDRCRQILSSVDLRTLATAGIRRDPSRYHATVMYPGAKAMEPITEERIFAERHTAADKFTLYVHIPYCSEKCSFCYFHTNPGATSEAHATYVRYLLKEARLLAVHIERLHGKVSLSSVFIGGGTPTLLSEAMFSGFWAGLREIFTLVSDCEVTVEVHPEICRENATSKLKNLRANGVNRLNFGVQSFDEDMLALTNRRHTSREAVQAIELAREVGFPNINIDLLYPLPDLTPQSWGESLRQAFSLLPDSVTTYFTSFKNNSLARMLHELPERFPDDFTNHLMRVMSVEYARQAGYNDQALVDWFVKPRQGCHYNHQERELRQTESCQLLAIGSSAFSYYNHYQYHTFPDLGRYYEALDNDRYPCWRGIELGDKERLARSMILGIKAGAVDSGYIDSLFGKDAVVTTYGPELARLRRLGLIDIDGRVIRLTWKGRLFADEISVRFTSREIRNRLLSQNWTRESDRALIERYDFMYDVELHEPVRPGKRHCASHRDPSA